ncbi:MAG: TolC family protein, partial [Candidatus Marinimicrobia bacterium]|nr:TolC family protein [Candidatus Neomarinimicrobiota bacterium]
MMRKKMLIIFIGIALTFLSGGAFAETLEDAWNIGLQVDHTLKAAEQDTLSMQASLAAAKGSRLPTVNVGAGYRVLDNEPVSIAGNIQFSTADDTALSYHAMTSLPIYTHFQISSMINAASAGMSASKYTEHALRQTIKLKIAEAYIAVLLRIRQVKVADSQELSLVAHAGDVQNLYDEGMVPLNDLLAAKVALANAQQTTLRTQNRLDVAMAEYNRLLGRPLDQTFQLDMIPLVFPKIELEV